MDIPEKVMSFIMNFENTLKRAIQEISEYVQTFRNKRSTFENKVMRYINNVSDVFCNIDYLFEIIYLIALFQLYDQFSTIAANKTECVNDLTNELETKLDQFLYELHMNFLIVIKSISQPLIEYQLRLKECKDIDKNITLVEKCANIVSDCVNAKKTMINCNINFIAQGRGRK